MSKDRNLGKEKDFSHEVHRQLRQVAGIAKVFYVLRKGHEYYYDPENDRVQLDHMSFPEDMIAWFDSEDERARKNEQEQKGGLM